MCPQKRRKPPSKPEPAKTEAPVERKREGPLSLYPLSPEEAITAFMNADPAKVEERLRQKGIKKPKK